MSTYQTQKRWGANEVGTLSVTNLGSPPPRADAPTRTNLLRVGAPGAVLPRAVSAVIKLGDLGTVLGPIDVPFALVGEAPFDVHLTPEPGAEPVSVLLQSSEVGALTDRLYATRSIRVAIGDAVVLPQWVRGVAALAPTTFTFQDRAGAPISSVGLTGAHDRPSLAYSVLINAAGVLTLYY